jgi:hypothetical protein
MLTRARKVAFALLAGLVLIALTATAITAPGLFRQEREEASIPFPEDIPIVAIVGNSSTGALVLHDLHQQPSHIGEIRVWGGEPASFESLPQGALVLVDGWWISALPPEARTAVLDQLGQEWAARPDVALVVMGADAKAHAEAAFQASGVQVTARGEEIAPPSGLVYVGFRKAPLYSGMSVSGDPSDTASVRSGLADLVAWAGR